MSIRLRLTIYWTAITTAVLFTAGVLIVVSFSRQMWAGLDAALLEEADTTAATLAHSEPGDTAAILRRLSQEKDLGPGRRVRLVVNHRVMFDDGDKTSDLPSVLPKNTDGRIVNGTGHRYRFAVVPLAVNNHAAWLEDGVDASRIRRTIDNLRRALLLVLPVILGLCVGGGYWMSARALTPLNEVTGALARIGPRDLQKRLPVSNFHDEAGQLTQAINQLLERLDRASALQGRFVSEAAHELRTPLTVLRSGLEVALQKPRSAEDNRMALEQALGEVERLCTIAEDLLTLARMDAYPGVERDRVDLGEVAVDAAAIAQTLAAAKRQNLEIRTGQGILVQGSAGDLRRVVLNLLDNAVKFTPPRGIIELDVAADGVTAILSVRDNGPGVDPGDMPHIFDPFYRSRGATDDGSGLGLALCREIVRLHKGVIRAANRAGGGCEVQVRLPLMSR